MTLREQRYEFDEEEARIESRLEEIATEVASLDDVPENASRRQQLLTEGEQLDTELAGVRWAGSAHEDGAVDVWDADVDGVTLAGLTGREFGRLQDDLEQDGGAGSGTTRVLLVAEATVDAPYLAGDEARTVAATGELPVAYLQWAKARIDELTGGDPGNGNSFGDYLVAAQAERSARDS